MRHQSNREDTDLPSHLTFTVFGEPVEILASSESTHRSFCMLIQTSPPGGGPPPHVHEREEEIFSVLEGEFELFDGQQWTKLQPGEHRFVLCGQVHTFRNSGAADGKILCIAMPGGLDEYLETISPLAIPRDMDRLIEISKAHGIAFVTPEPPQSPPL